MNGKRQTIWLVSMLSLMVLLSAYYLFTEGVGKLKDVTQAQEQPTQVKVDLSELGKDGEKSETDAAGKKDGKSDTKTEGKDSTASGKQQDDSKAASTDAQVLEKMEQKKTGKEFFDQQLMKRNEVMQKEATRLMEIANDSKKTPEEVSKAEQDLKAIQDTVARVANVEDSLNKDFKNAVVVQEDNKWKVTIQANKLEKSQAVSIVDRIMKELKIGPEKVVVQYIQ